MEMMPSPRGPRPSSILSPRSLSLSCGPPPPPAKSRNNTPSDERQENPRAQDFYAAPHAWLWLTLRSAKGMVTVRTVGGRRSIARQRHRTGRAAGAEATAKEAARPWPRDLLPGAAAGAQVCCVRTVLPISTTTLE